MKVKVSLRPICQDCYLVRRGKKLYMRCKSQPRHKRRQRFSTLIQPSFLQMQMAQDMNPIWQQNWMLFNSPMQIELLQKIEHNDWMTQNMLERSYV